MEGIGEGGYFNLCRAGGGIAYVYFDVDGCQLTLTIESKNLRRKISHHKPKGFVPRV